MNTSTPVIEAAGLRQWDHAFEFEGHAYTLFKRKDSRHAPFYIDFVHDNHRIKRGLKSNVAKDAQEAAIERFIKPAKDGIEHVAAVTADGEGIRRWDHRFKFEGHSYTLFKREDSRDGYYYIDFTIDGRNNRTKRSLKTNSAEAAQRIAVENLIKPAKMGHWGQVDKTRSKTQFPTLAKVQAIYEVKAPLGIKGRSATNNMGQLRSVIGIARGDVNLNEFCIGELGAKLVREFKENFMKARLAGVKGEDAVELARRKAWGTGNSKLGQARSVFCKWARAAYKDAGLKLPDTIMEFLQEPLFKKLPVVYSPAPDSVVKATFAAVQGFLKPVPDRERVAVHALPNGELTKVDGHEQEITATQKNRNCYLAFWLAVGCGLRKGEIARARWEFIKEQDGAIWFIANVPGKDGLAIKVPIVTDAWEYLKAHRQESGPVLLGSATEVRDKWSRRIGDWMDGLGWNSEKKIHELRAYIGSKIAEKHGIFQAHLFLRHKDVRTTKQYYGRYLEMRPLSVAMPVTLAVAA